LVAVTTDTPLGVSIPWMTAGACDDVAPLADVEVDVEVALPDAATVLLAGSAEPPHALSSAAEATKARISRQRGFRFRMHPPESAVQDRVPICEEHLKRGSEIDCDETERPG
jgi:hypothetical protein